MCSTQSGSCIFPKKPANSPGVRKGPSAIMLGKATKAGTADFFFLQVGNNRAGVGKVHRRGVGCHVIDQRLPAGQGIIGAGIMVGTIVLNATNQGKLIGTSSKQGKCSVT